MENEGKGCVATRIMGNQLKLCSDTHFFVRKPVSRIEGG